MSAAFYDPILNAQRSRYTHPGFADCYDAYRPRPPAVLLDVLLQLAHTARPDLVVDLGSGTGISTFIWTQRARQVLGIEPLDAMRRTAEAANTAPHVRFQGGIARHTGLPDGAADIVTCAQALHWMEPASTLAEVARILQAGGVFAAYDYEGPPRYIGRPSAPSTTAWRGCRSGTSGMGSPARSSGRRVSIWRAYGRVATFGMSRRSCCTMSSRALQSAGSAMP